MMNLGKNENQPAGLQLLKLGGSLITDKSTPSSARREVIERVAGEISAYRQETPQSRLVIGHGSGSFGHVAGDQYKTRAGVYNAEQWLGFIEVWKQASALHRIVIDAFLEAGVPVLSFPPSAAVQAENGKIVRWDTELIHSALEHNLIPVIYGDVVFDLQRGGTILSTEELFESLARQLHPKRILLAGLVDGVCEDFPACTKRIGEITPANMAVVEPALGESMATDVTGGMASKVRQSLELCKELEGLEVWIFSGTSPGSVKRALSGSITGTVIRAHPG